MAPAARPSGSCCISSRKIANRVDWPKAESADTASALDLTGRLEIRSPWPLAAGTRLSMHFNSFADSADLNAPILT
jgi:hypothetical protein